VVANESIVLSKKIEIHQSSYFPNARVVDHITSSRSMSAKIINIGQCLTKS